MTTANSLNTTVNTEVFNFALFKKKNKNNKKKQTVDDLKNEIEQQVANISTNDPDFLLFLHSRYVYPFQSVPFVDTNLKKLAEIITIVILFKENKNILFTRISAEEKKSLVSILGSLFKEENLKFCFRESTSGAGNYLEVAFD